MTAGKDRQLLLTHYFNLYTMQTIFWICVGLLVIASIAVGHTVRQHNKMFNDNEDPVPDDDSPIYYEDCERPFYNH